MRAVATDADGTLWTTDVGDRLFLTAAQRGDIRPRALARLRQNAALLLPTVPDDPVVLARSLLEGYAAGRIAIGPMCALEAEAVGDRSQLELQALVDDVGAMMAMEIRPEAREILVGARARGFSVHVVSGSLAVAVQAVLRIAGMPVDSIHGAMLETQGTQVIAAVAGPIPLFEAKVQALMSAGAWPAALGMGDGGWDATFLREVHVPVLMHPKQALVDAMAGHPRRVTVT